MDDNHSVQKLSSMNSKPDEEKYHWGMLGLHGWIRIGIVGVLFCALFRHEIHRLVSDWEDPSWSHGVLIPLFSLYFLNQHKKDLLRESFKPNYLGLVLLLLLLIFYPINIVHLQYGYFKPLTMIAVLGAIVLFLGGWKLVRYTWLPIGFLIFAVPLPSRYYRGLTIPLRILASNIASVLLSLVKDLEATASGVVIDVMYKGQPLDPPLDVAEACSGMRLLMAFLALGVAMAYLHYRPIWQRIVLLCSTIPIAIICNVIRVTITGFIYILLNPKYAQGVYHDMLGIVMLPLAFGLYGALAWFMSSLFVEEDENGPAEEDIVVRRRG